MTSCGFGGLADGFARSGVEVWDYRGEGRTTAGRSLALEFEQLVTSDLVVVVVSPRSLSNPHVAREVACAAARWPAIQRRLFVVTIPGTPPQAHWPTPFGKVADVIALPATTPARVDDLAAEILGALAVEYVARAHDPARLPVLRRTIEELAAVDDGGRRALATCPQSQFNALIRTIENAGRAYEDADYGGAASSLERARLQLATIAPTSRPYYLAIAIAVCALHRGKVDGAAEALVAIARHPAIDESWHGAQAMVAVARGDWAAARAACVEAVRVCQARRTSAFEAMVNLRAIELKLGIDGDAVPKGDVLDRAEFVTVATVEAATHLRSQRPDLAVRAFAGVEAAEHDDASIGVYAEALEAAGLVPQALAALRAHLDVSRRPGERLAAQRVVLWRAYATNLVDQGHLCDAIAVYGDVLCAGVDEGQHTALLEHARLLRLAGRQDEMRQVCERALAAPPRAPAPEDHYGLGLAAHLLGQVQVASMMFAWSRDHGPAYEELLAADDRDGLAGTAACRGGACSCQCRQGRLDRGSGATVVASTWSR
jgi:hypothetical protein